MNKFTIPTERKDIGGRNFKKELEERKATNEQDYKEKYRELKYKFIWFNVWVVLPIAALLLCVSSVCNWLVLKGYCMWYLQAMATLYIGSLIAKD